MRLVFDIRRSLPGSRRETGYVAIQIMRVVNLEDHVPKTARTSIIVLALQRTHAEAVTQKQLLVE